MTDNADTSKSTAQTRDRVLLTAKAQESIKDDIEKLKEMAGGDSNLKETGYSPASQIDDIVINKDKIRAEIARLTKQLEDTAPKRVCDDLDRKKLFARRAELERKFKEYLESFQDLNVISRSSPDWGPAFRKAMKRPEVNHLIMEWKRIGLRLEPDDQFINDLDRLRKDR